MDNKDITYYENLIISYLADDVSDKQVLEIEEYVTSSTKNADHFKSIKSKWSQAKVINSGVDIDEKKAWTHVRKQISTDLGASKVIPLWKRPWSIAASILLLVAAGFLLWNTQQEQSIEAFAHQKELISLPDGSEVNLNNGASLSYINNTKTNQRELSLKGDAFFSIKKNPQKPFVISAGDVEVSVLGTSFYIDNRPEKDNVVVEVATGKVSVVKGNEQIILKPGEQAIYNKTKDVLSKSVVQIRNINFLQTKELRFENDDLATVVDLLERYYQADFELANTALNKCKFNAVIKDKSIDVTMKVLSTALGLDYRKEKNKIILFGECQ